MEKETKQQAFLKILGRMIGTIHIETTQTLQMCAESAEDQFKSLMDLAIEKAHKAMEESEKYKVEEETITITGEEMNRNLERARRIFDAGRAYSMRRRGEIDPDIDKEPF